MSDPLSNRERLRGLARHTKSRILNRLRRTTDRHMGAAPRGRPFLDYRRELSGAPAGRALLSYLAEPFHHQPDYSGKQDYSNWMMSLEIANALNRIGFVVDVINYDDYDVIPTRGYDVFIGMAANFSRLLPLMRAQTRTVYWATRPDPASEMEAIRQRQLKLFQRRRKWVPIPEALLPLLESADYHRADALILIGNSDVRSTFRTPSNRVYCVDNPAIEFSSSDTGVRDLSQARSHFLFLSSWLLVRKGLDLALEVFAERPDLQLWICGPVDSEPQLMRAYRQELFHTPNIHPLGWVGMQSAEFAEVTKRCAYLVFPSCAEGMSGSVINGMARGLVPICTAETGVDLDDFGLPVTDPSPQGLGEVIDLAASLPIEELQRRGEAARSAAARRYTVGNFRQQIQSALEKSIERR